MQPDCEIELWACVTEQNGKCARGRREREEESLEPWFSLSLSLFSLSLCCVFSERGRVCSLTRCWMVNGICAVLLCVCDSNIPSVCPQMLPQQEWDPKEAPEDLRSVSGWLKKSWWMSESESERTFLGHISS